MLRRTGRLVAAAAGVALPLAFAPFHLWWLAPALLALLFATWVDQTPREAAWRGFCFGFGAFGAGTYWLYISIHIFGGAPLWLAVFLMLSLVCLMALYVAASGWISARMEGPAVFRWCVLWPAVWTLVEWIRGWLFSGFPWLSLGYGQIDGPLKNLAPVIGLHGVSLATAALAGGFVVIALGHRWERLVGLGTLLVFGSASLLLAGRGWTVPEGDEISVALIQGSISQDRKWLPEQRGPTLDLYRDLTFGLGGVDLVVWPEVAVPAVAEQVEDYLTDIERRARARGMQLLLGIMTYDAEREQVRNSLLSLGEQNDSYHKRHLVPFGEFFPVPGFIREWMRLMSLPYKDTSPGEREQPPLRAGELALAPSICYEDAFGAEQLDFLPAAQLLVNVSNDAWFGDSIAPHQHLQIARMRALESGRFMLRATNTGITAVISPAGEVRKASPQFRAHVLTDKVRSHTGATPYVRWGNYPVLVACAVLIAIGFRRRIRT
jgi:apolipoprotein N-acyltransferase